MGDFGPLLPDQTFGFALMFVLVAAPLAVAFCIGLLVGQTRIRRDAAGRLGLAPARRVESYYHRVEPNAYPDHPRS